MGELDGRVAIVTGASRGIGAAIARRFAAEGAAVVAVARTVDATTASRYPGTLTDTVGGIQARGGTALAVPADLAAGESRRMIVERTLASFGRVDVLVNNAAASWAKPIATFPPRQYATMWEVHVHASVELAQLVVASMVTRGDGWICNLTSTEARHPDGPPYVAASDRAGLTVYGMCKAALERFSTGLAAELFDDGIAVNALAPSGGVLTYGMHHPPVPEGRPDLVEPVEHTAEAALALCTVPGLTGRIAYTRPLLDELRRPVADLDGHPLAPA